MMNCKQSGGVPIVMMVLPVIIAISKITGAMEAKDEEVTETQPPFDFVDVVTSFEKVQQEKPDNLQKDEAIEHLKEVLGIRGNVKNESRNEVLPQFMMELYNIVADSNSEAQGKNPYNAKVVRSFIEKENSSPHDYIFNVSALEQNESVLEAELHLYRKISSPNSVHPSVLYSPHYLIKVYQVLPERSLEEPDFHRLLNVHYVGAYESGWEVFNVKQAVLSWLSGVPNLGFLVTATTIFGDRVTVNFSRRDGDEANDKQPILVLFNDVGAGIHNIIAYSNTGGNLEKEEEKEHVDAKDDESENEDRVIAGNVTESIRVRNKRRLTGQLETVPKNIEDNRPIHFHREKKNEKKRELNNERISRRKSLVEAFTSMDIYQRAMLREQLNSRRKNYVTPNSRKKRSTWPFFNLDQEQETLSRDKRNMTSVECRKEEMEPCAKRELYVNFRDIGLTTIIAPEGYAAYQCRGHCKSPLSQDQKPTNHATIQGIIQKMNLAPSQDVNKPCCVPINLSSISILYHNDDRDEVILKSYADMAVVNCGCR